MPYSATHAKGTKYVMDKLDFNSLQYNFNGKYRHIDLSRATYATINELQNRVLQKTCGGKRTRSKQPEITNQPNDK